jgi:hypothetical protein
MEITTADQLHDLVCQIAADEPEAERMGLQVDITREIVRLRSPGVTIDVDGDGIPDGPLHATLDAENAPFTGLRHVVFSLSAADQPLWTSALVSDDLQLEHDGDYSGEVASAMDEQFDRLLNAIGARSSS